MHKCSRKVSCYWVVIISTMCPWVLVEFCLAFSFLCRDSLHMVGILYCLPCMGGVPVSFLPRGAPMQGSCHWGSAFFCEEQAMCAITSQGQTWSGTPFGRALPLYIERCPCLPLEAGIVTGSNHRTPQIRIRACGVRGASFCWISHVLRGRPASFSLDMQVYISLMRPENTDWAVYS